MIKVGIVGGSGYTGGELIRILLNHPNAKIDFVYSTTRADKKITTAHPDLLGVTDLKCTGTINPDADVVFLCLGHGNSTKFLTENEFSKDTRIIDLSNDFRLAADAVLGDRNFVYGLPELKKAEIRNARYIANPGCFATGIQFALLPLAQAKLWANPVHINAVTGSTRAGVSLSATSHYSWRNNNVSWYKPFTHQHLGEIKESLNKLQKNTGELFSLANRANITREISATAYPDFKGGLEEAYSLYSGFYKDAAYAQITEDD